MSKRSKKSLMCLLGVFCLLTMFLAGSVQANDLVKTYLKGLEARDIDSIMVLFTPDGTVHSPVFGKIPAQQFYKDFFADTSKMDVELLGIFWKREDYLR